MHTQQSSTSVAHTSTTITRKAEIYSSAETVSKKKETNQRIRNRDTKNNIQNPYTLENIYLKEVTADNPFTHLLVFCRRLN